jgi:hypothetical protein
MKDRSSNVISSLLVAMAVTVSSSALAADEPGQAAATTMNPQDSSAGTPRRAGGMGKGMGPCGPGGERSPACASERGQGRGQAYGRPGYGRYEDRGQGYGPGGRYGDSRGRQGYDRAGQGYEQGGYGRGWQGYGPGGQEGYGRPEYGYGRGSEEGYGPGYGYGRGGQGYGRSGPYYGEGGQGYGGGRGYGYGQGQGNPQRYRKRDGSGQGAGPGMSQRSMQPAPQGAPQLETPPATAPAEQ